MPMAGHKQLTGGIGRLIYFKRKKRRAMRLILH